MDFESFPPVQERPPAVNDELVLRLVVLSSCAVLLASAACSRAPARASIPAAAESAAPPPAPVAEPVAPLAAAVVNADAGAPPVAAVAAAGCRGAMFDEPPDLDGGARTPGVPSKKQKPFAMTIELPAGRLGDPVLDRAVRGAMTAYCAEREHAFFADATREQRDGRPAKNFYDDCVCDPAYVSEKLVSVACSNQESLAGAHPAWRYAGFTFTLAGGAAKEVRLQDVCAPAEPCAKRLAEVLLTLPDGPTAYHQATLTKYLAKPTFVLGRTALRLLVDEDLSGYAAHGLSCDLPYGELGALSRLRPDAATK